MLKKCLISLGLISSLFVFVVSVQAAINSYSASNFESISCLVVSDYISGFFTPWDDIVTVTLTGTGFGDRDLDDDTLEVIYIPVNSKLFRVYRGQREEGDYFGLQSWSDTEIQFEFKSALAESIESYVIFEIYNSPIDDNGVCVSGDLSLEPEACTEDTWECGDWDTCSIEGIETRSCSLTDDCDLVESEEPETTQSCTPACTEDTWECGDWDTCSIDGIETRSCSLIDDCDLVESEEPETTQSCTPACTEDIWECGDWHACSENGEQERSCSLIDDCDLVESSSPDIKQSCTLECSEDTWECSDWDVCSVDGIETRSCSLIDDCDLVDSDEPETTQSCTPGPTITSLSPSTIYPGTEVTVIGYGFGEYYNTYGRYGDLLLGGEDMDVNSSDWEDTQIVFTVPEDATGSSSVQVSLDYDVASNYYSFTISEVPVVLPTITSISPQSITPGDTITIKGSDFGDEQDDSDIIVDGMNYAFYGSVTSWSDTEIEYLTTVSVSTSMKIGIRNCASSSGCQDIYGEYFYLQPEITRIYNKYNVVGEPLTIHGNYLKSENIRSDSADVYSLEVFFDGVSATETLSEWTDDQIVVAIPEGATDGYITIELTSDGTTDKVTATGPYFDVSDTISNDEYSAYQDYFQQVNIPGAWSISADRRDIVVAVIDSGVDITHPDLENAIWENENEIADNGIDDDGNGYIDDIYGWDFRSDSNNTTPASNHGTQVAGIIAAEINNSEGMAGVNPNAKIMSLNIFSSEESGTSVTYVTEAIHYAVDNGAEVINLSIGTGNDSYDSAYQEAFDEPLQYAYDHNVLVVAAAGNGNADKEGYYLNETPQSPVCNNGDGNIVIGVGSVDSDNDQTSWSNYGDECVDIWAPGEKILSTSMTIYSDGEFQDDDYQRNQGTSFSAPIVTGVVSLLKAAYEDLTSEQAVDFLLNNANGGVLDAYQTLKDADSNPPVNEQEVESEVVAESTEPVFNDVSESVQYFDAILYVENQGIVEGYDDGYYRPVNLINRAEFTKILIEAVHSSDVSEEDGATCLSDVVETEWYAKYVCFAKENEIIEGYPDGTFLPDQYINVAEALKITLETYFDDIPDVDGEWYQKYWDYAENADYIIWDSPAEYLSRGEMAELIYRIEN